MINTLDENLALALNAYEITVKEIKEKHHPSTFHMVRVLAPNPKLPPHLYNLSAHVFELGLNMINLGDGDELTAGLRKLMEAKDCFVRAALDSDPVNYNDR